MEKIVFYDEKNAKICFRGYGYRRPDFWESDGLFGVLGTVRTGISRPETFPVSTEFNKKSVKIAARISEIF